MKDGAMVDTKTLVVVSGLLFAAVSARADTTITLPEVSGQIVRVELPGRQRPLRLAEVEVYAKGENVALLKRATHSSIFSDIKKYYPGVAVDGARAGNTGSYTKNEDNPWWEVDLGRTEEIDKVIIYKSSKSLKNFTLKILDRSRNVVFSKEGIPQADQVVFMKKDLGAIWLIGDSITQGNADGDDASSPRKALYDQLKANGYSFSFTGHHAANVDGLPATGETPADNLYHYHSGVSGIKIAQMTGGLVKAWNLGRLETVKPDNICIMLGTNDIGRGEIDGAPERLKALLDQIYALPGIGDPRVFLASIPPNRRKEAERTDVIIFNEAVQQLAAKYKSEEGKDIIFVNHFQALDDAYGESMRPDNLHPNAAGNAIMGEQWFEAIEGALLAEGTDQGEMLFPGSRTFLEYNRNYHQYQFTVPNPATGRDVNVVIIPPKEPAPGKPWLWRNIFYTSNTGQSIITDLELIDEGYHAVVVYGNVTGHPNGNANVKAVYDYLTKEHGFSKTFSASAMSRGGFMVFAYASAYPEQIESIFMDNACADALSWPAGNKHAGHLGYKGPGSEASFQMYLNAYDEFSTFPEAVEYLKTAGSPIHQLEPLAKAGVPILSICGSDDHAVPYEENDAVLEKRYKALGGDITVIVEDKGHRHGTRENKNVLLDFIRKHTRP